MAKLSLICPTIGRSTLLAMAESVLLQMHEGDELIIVGDGPQPNARVIAKLPGVRYMETETKTGDYGCTPCDLGIKMASGDAVFFIGDDDTCPPGAFDAIHRGFAMNPFVPHVFSMLHTGRVLGGSVACCAVSGQQIVVPRNMNKMPRMAECPPGNMNISDWVFIDKVHRAWGGQTVFHPEIIAVLPQQNSGRMF